MRIIRAAIFSVYFTIWLVALILGPLVVLHGYRAWWLDIAFGVLGIAVIGGNIAHYRGSGRNGDSPSHGHGPTAHAA